LLSSSAALSTTGVERHEIDWNKESFHDRSGDNNFAATRRGKAIPKCEPGKFCAVCWQQREDGAATMTMR
jgi:hypothetical protein